MDKELTRYNHISLFGTVKDRIFHLLVTKLEELKTKIGDCICGADISAWKAKAKQVT
jgi:hypothetical protein